MQPETIPCFINYWKSCSWGEKNPGIFRRYFGSEKGRRYSGDWHLTCSSASASERNQQHFFASLAEPQTYSAFPEPPLYPLIITVKTHTLLIAVIKNRRFSALCQWRGCQPLSPLAVAQGLPSIQRVLAPGPGQPPLPRAVLPPAIQARTRYQGRAQDSCSSHTPARCLETYTAAQKWAAPQYDLLQPAKPPSQEETASSTMYPKAAAASRRSEGTIRA